MSSAQAAHQRFVEFVAEFHRDAGCELPYFESDADHPIAFQVRVQGVKVTIGYDPLAAGANLFVHCVFGTPPAHEEAAALRRLLLRNLQQARAYGATYCLDSSTQEVVCYERRPVAGLDVASLREDLVRIAGQALQWRTDHFAGEVEALGGAEPSDAWAAFA
jgi:hypothetical protein